MKVTFYDTSGRMLRINEVADESEIAANCPVGCDYVTGAHDPKTQWVDAGVVSPRPVVTPMTGPTYDLTHLPDHLVVTDPEGVETIVSAQPDMLRLIGPGAYRVRSVSPFPWIDFDVEVIAP